MPSLITPRLLKCKEEAERRVMQIFKISSEEINSPERFGNTSNARFVSFYILRVQFGLKLSVIGQMYGKHHSSIKYGLDRVATLGLAKDLDIKPRKKRS